MGHYTKLYGNTTCDYNDKYLCVLFFFIRRGHSTDRSCISFSVRLEFGVVGAFNECRFIKPALNAVRCPDFHIDKHIYLVHYCSCLFAQTTYTAVTFFGPFLDHFFRFVLFYWKFLCFFFPSRIFIRSHSNISIWDAYEPKGV